MSSEIRQLSKKIKDEVGFYQKSIIDINPSYAPTTPEVLKHISLYYNSKMKDGDFDAQGLKKFFYNICYNPVWVAVKMIDLDTKNIMLIPDGNQDAYPVWIFEKNLKYYLRSMRNRKDQSFAQLLNEIAQYLTRDGHIVLKKVRGTIHRLKLKNCITDPYVDRFINADFFTEHLEYSGAELLRDAKERGWGNEDALQKLVLIHNKKMGEGKASNFISVYERYDLRKDKNNHSIVVGVNVDGKSERSLGEPVLLDQNSVSEADLKSRYKEHKFEDTDERWLGRGEVELLFEPQIAINQNEYYENRSKEWTSKIVFQSPDDLIEKNLTTEVDSGYVVKSKNGISRVPIEERNLGVYQTSHEKWRANADDKTFSKDLVRGERLPSGTPLGSAVLQTQMLTGFFDVKREDFGMFIKSVLQDWIIPDFKKLNTKKHNFNLMRDDEDWDKFKKLKLNRSTAETLFADIIMKGIVPDRNAVMAVREIDALRIKNMRSIDLKVPEKYYSELAYTMDIVITAEQVDLNSNLQNLIGIIPYISQPGALQNPTVRKIVQRIFDLVGGVSSLDIEDTEDQNMLGQLAAPQPASNVAPAAPRPGNGLTAPAAANAVGATPQTV